MIVPMALLLAALAATSNIAFGQQTEGKPAASRTGPRPMLAIAEEVSLARSAAPLSISAKARVLVLTDTGYAVADGGSSDVTCVVNRSWNVSIEPHCYDSEAAVTVMPLELRRNYLRHLGRSEKDIEDDLARGLASGKYRLPARPAMTYMMSPAQVLYDDDGSHVGKWRPHLMIYYPDLTNRMLALPEKPEMRVGMVTGSGAESSLMIVLAAFAEPPSSHR